MKTYDFERAKYLINDNIQDAVSAALGMSEDWYWTAEDIWSKDRGYHLALNPGASISGIESSSWATPALKISFSDGKEKMFECYMGESEPWKDACDRPSFGCISGPCQEEINKIEVVK